MKQLETGDASQTSQDSAIENLAGKPQFYTSVSLTWLTGLGREGVASVLDYFLLADYPGAIVCTTHLEAGRRAPHRSDQRRHSLTGCHCVRKMKRPETKHPLVIGQSNRQTLPQRASVYFQCFMLPQSANVASIC
jgi:hypothetical protein